MRRFLSLLLTRAALVLTMSHAPGAAGHGWPSVASARVAGSVVATVRLDHDHRMGVHAPTWTSEAAVQSAPPSVLSVVRHDIRVPDVRSARRVVPIDAAPWVAPAPGAVRRIRSAHTARLATEFALAARGAHAPFFSTAPPLRG
jgi:hypothetical protein